MQPVPPPYRGGFVGPPVEAPPDAEPALELEVVTVKTPGVRLLRTILQVVVSLGVAIPAAVALLPIDAAAAAWACGIAGAAVVIASAVQNGLDDMRGRQ